MEEKASTVDLDDARGDGIKQMAVVRHTQQAALESFEAFLKPVDGIDIEMVRGLVEHEQISRGDQGTRQCNPSLLATTHGLHPVARAVTEPKPVENCGCLPRIADRVERSDVVEDRALGKHCDRDPTLFANNALVWLDVAGRNTKQR